MNKVISKVLSVVLILVMIVSVTVVPMDGSMFKAQAADTVKSGSCGRYVTFKLDSDGLLTISGMGDMSDYESFRDHMFEEGSVTPWPKDDVKRVVIEEGVTRIGTYAFSNHGNLTEIKIPTSVVSIGEGAFEYCGSLLLLTLPKFLTSIPKYMCAISGLRYVYIPDSVTVIDNGAFYAINTLLEIEFGGTEQQWKKVDVKANNDSFENAHMVYYGDNKLTSLQSGTCGNNVNWKLTPDGTLTISGNGKMDSYEKGAVSGYYVQPGEGKDHPWFKYRSKIKKIIISSGVTSVGAYAFFDCFNCTSLEIQKGVTAIQDGAFAHMSISEVTLPDSVATLGKAAFNNCTALSKIKLSDKITVIDDRTFEYCRILKSIDLPNKLKKINYSAFYLCDFEKITIPATVTYIGANFANVKTVLFLGPNPFDDYNSPPAQILSADYCCCLPEYYESYKNVFQKNRADAILSDGDIRAKLNKTSITLTADDPVFKLTVSDETGRAKTLSKKWWLEKTEVASVDQNGTVTASGHGKTMLYVEISANGQRSMASCYVATKRNDLMVDLLPKDIKPDFPVSYAASIGEHEPIGYQPGKLAEKDTSNQYYQELLALTKELTADCSTDELKAKEIWDWVSTNVSYGGAIGIGTTAEQAYAVYVNRKAHCEGYAKLTGFMLYLADIPSCLVASEGHMWNIALLDGEWTMIDSTNRRFGEDYNSCGTIMWIGFGMDDLCFVIDSTEGVKLAGVGDHCIREEREKFNSVVVPDFVDIIFGFAFDSCVNLKSVTIPNSVKVISSYAFDDCDKLTDVYFDGTREEWKNVRINENNDCLLNARMHYLKGGQVIPGDVNLDEKVNTTDALLCLIHTVGKTVLTGDSFLAADITKDNKVNATDALRILQFAVGKIKEF